MSPALQYCTDLLPASNSIIPDRNLRDTAVSHPGTIDFKRIFAIGDIHGCSQKLAALLKMLPFDPHMDLLVFLGDYIDRGPESKEVLNILLDLRRRADNVVFLMGNHEHTVLEYSRTGDPDDLRLLRPFGVEETLKSYGIGQIRQLRGLSFLPADHRSFLEGLPLFFRAGGYLFTHAGIVPGEDIETCPPDRLLTVRRTFLEYTGKLDETVIFGHTPFLTPFVTRDRIGIDTGAVYGNLLTTVELPANRFYHA
jgi:serine/threonine protein phosphatase 1